jgi:hypothetical protein
MTAQLPVRVADGPTATREHMPFAGHRSVAQWLPKTAGQKRGEWLEREIAVQVLEQHREEEMRTLARAQAELQPREVDE